MVLRTQLIWESRKQQTIALSSTEAEYMAISDAAQEAVYLRRFITELLGAQKPVVTFNDNQGAVEPIANGSSIMEPKTTDNEIMDRMDVTNDDNSNNISRNVRSARGTASNSSEGSMGTCGTVQLFQGIRHNMHSSIRTFTKQYRL
ncbi:uncharacterized protein LOC119667624 [Teleopsis dalmanni]|uniref:uncharacterized protein LOC119667624 n=1 Tax=Teleopsis dalmanni TaxID=139649 RepID=UPI0018CEC1C4|nr:uncharacterized protein LOC119667624 [Teleopsis dalmanni]